MCLQRPRWCVSRAVELHRCSHAVLGKRSRRIERVCLGPNQSMRHAPTLGTQSNSAVSGRGIRTLPTVRCMQATDPETYIRNESGVERDARKTSAAECPVESMPGDNKECGRFHNHDRTLTARRHFSARRRRRERCVGDGQRVSRRAGAEQLGQGGDPTARHREPPPRA